MSLARCPSVRRRSVLAFPQVVFARPPPRSDPCQVNAEESEFSMGIGIAEVESPVAPGVEHRPDRGRVIPRIVESTSEPLIHRNMRSRRIRAGVSRCRIRNLGLQNVSQAGRLEAARTGSVRASSGKHAAARKEKGRVRRPGHWLLVTGYW